MTDFRPPGNPVKLRSSKVSDFAGIGGRRRVVIKKTNERGWDISNVFCNESWDLNLSTAGLARLRDGKRKIDNTGEAATIDALFLINVGGKLRYGFKHDGVIDVIDIPDYTLRMLDVVVLDPEPTRTAIANEYPILDPSEWTT